MLEIFYDKYTYFILLFCVVCSISKFLNNNNHDILWKIELFAYVEHDINISLKSIDKSSDNKSK